MEYLSNKEESSAIRKMIKEKYPDFKIGRNSHGRGTACGWIHVDVIYPDWFGYSMSKDEIWKFSRFVYRDIKESVGRGHLHDDIQSDYFCEDILFGFWSREEWNRRNGKNLKDWTFRIEKAVPK